MTQAPAKLPLTPERTAYLKWRANNNVMGPLLLGGIAGAFQALTIVYATEIDSNGTPNLFLKWGLGLAAAWIGTSALTQSRWAVSISKLYWAILLITSVAEPFVPLFVKVRTYPGAEPMFSDNWSRASCFIAALLAGGALFWSRNPDFIQFRAYISSKQRHRRTAA